MLRVDQPGTARAAQAALQRAVADGQACAFVGGGTALQLAWGDASPALRLVDVSRLPEAQGIARVDDHLRVGAAVRLEALRRDPLVARHAPLLAQACGSLAALSVRHLGTLGGNVGWGFGDSLPALLAMDALAELADGDVTPLQALLTGPGPMPLLVALRVDAHRFGPLGGAGVIGFQEKVGHRAAFSPARLNLALTATRSGDGGWRDVRVAACAAGVTARRLRHLERQLEAAASPAITAAALGPACHADLPHDPADDGLLPRVAANLVAGWLRSSTP